MRVGWLLWKQEKVGTEIRYWEQGSCGLDSPVAAVGCSVSGHLSLVEGDHSPFSVRSILPMNHSTMPLSVQLCGAWRIGPFPASLVGTAAADCSNSIFLGRRPGRG